MSRLSERLASEGYIFTADDVRELEAERDRLRKAIGNYLLATVGTTKGRGPAWRELQAAARDDDD